MLAIAFWNVHKNQGASPHIEDLIRNLSTGTALPGHQGDVLCCLGEPTNVNAAQIVANLNGANLGPWWHHTSVDGRFVLLTNLNQGSVQIGAQVAGCQPVTVTRVVGANPLAYQIWFVHLTAPVGTAQQVILMQSVAAELTRAMQQQELAAANTRTLAIGDFNMPPYGPAMTAPQGLNAVACKKIAARGSRTVLGTVYEYFYNPMWGLLGNQTADNQPGSYYLQDKADSTRWQLLDQVIVRPTLMERFINDSPRVLTGTGNNNLLRASGRINENISDHLPVVVSLDV
ncbi:hypothetical protein [Burkholderia cepacia]|uniref:hypothetical protein n=1 Tax=Burkholderia cepacia TaxID=292 RepID=UPI002AB25C9F|nr:hypothetical protein [Burkholderia cepacia]